MLVQLLFLSVPTINPFHWNSEQTKIAKAIVHQAVVNDVNPYGLLAIAWGESNFKTDAVSHTGDYGILQINCRFWWKDLGYSSKKDCPAKLFDPEENIRAAIHVIKIHRDRYKRCRYPGVFLCYNGGPNWAKSKNREKIKAYNKRIHAIMYSLVANYGRWIESQIAKIDFSKFACLDDKISVTKLMVCGRHQIF